MRRACCEEFVPNRHDGVERRAVLADWYEEHGMPEMGVANRWMAREKRRPLYSPNISTSRRYSWWVGGPHPCGLPGRVFERLAGDEGRHSRYYATSREAEYALGAALLEGGGG